MEPADKRRELDAAIAEFTALWQEALHYLAERRHLLLLAVVVCTAILGYGSEAQNGYIASIAMFVSAGCMIMCLSAFNAPQRIGAYIRTFIERRHPGFYWEEALRRTFTDHCNHRTIVFGNRVYMIASYIVVFTSLAAVSGILTYMHASAVYAIPVCLAGGGLVLVGDVLLVYLPLFRMRRTWAFRFDEAYKSMWDGNAGPDCLQRTVSGREDTSGS